MPSRDNQEGLWARLHAAFHRPSSPSYRMVDTAVWVLIVISIGLITVELFAGPEVAALARQVDYAILAMFGLELALRVLTYQPPDLRVFHQPPLGALRTHVMARFAYLMRPTQLIDLITIVAVVPALRGLKVLRLLRLLRTVRVFRYGNPFTGLLAAFEADRLLFILAFALLGLQTVLGGVSLYLVERAAPDAQVTSLGEGLWWGLVTITTVGYGDYAPVTDLGRVIAGVMMVGGMITLALFAGVVGHSLLNAVLSIREEQFRMSGYVDHVVVCGYERGSGLLLSTLKEELEDRPTRVVLFANHERPPEVPPEFLFVSGDPTKESELDKVRLTHAASVIVVGSRQMGPQQADATTILTVFTLRAYLRRQANQKGRIRPVHVVAEVLDSENVEHARSAGADEVIESQRLGFSMLSHSVRYPGVGDLTSRVVASGAASFYVGRMPQELAFPVSFGELSRVVREQTNALVIGVLDPESGDKRINPEDTLQVNGTEEVVYLAEDPVLPGTRESQG